MKDKIASLQSEIDRLEKENSAGLLSMIRKDENPRSYSRAKGL